MSPARSRPLWSIVAGGIIGGALLYAAMRQVDWPAVGAAIAHVSPLWLLAAMVAAAAAQTLFAARWHAMAGRAHGMTFADAFDFLAIGALAGLVLPPRLSDVARAVAAGRYHATSATGLLGTIVVERVIDVLMLVAFGAAVSALMDVPPVVVGALLTLLAIVTIMVAVLWLGDRGPIGMAARWASRWRGHQSRLPAISARFLAGTGVIRERATMPRSLALAAAGWLCAAASIRLTLTAFDAAAPWYAGAFTVVIINLAGILPAPPAGVGVYHYAAMVGVSPWLPDASRAFAFALVSHALSVAVVIVLGTVSLARKGLSLRALRRLAQVRTGEAP